MRLLEFLELVCKKPLQHAVSAAVGFAIQQFRKVDNFQSARIRFCVIFDLIAYKISERRPPPSICGLVWQTNRAPGRSHREPTLGHCRDLELSKIAQFLR